MNRTVANTPFFALVERLLAEGGEVRITVRGRSMRPLVRDGDTAILSPIAPGDGLRTGDVILFRHCGGYRLHRIVAAGPRSITAAGDGTFGPPETIPRRNAIARMRGVIRPSGKRLACDSAAWRLRSRLWLALPRLLRRLLLRSPRL